MENKRAVKKLIQEISQDMSDLSETQISQLNLLRPGFKDRTISFEVLDEGKEKIGQLIFPYKEGDKTYQREQIITDPNVIAYILGLQKLAELDNND